MNTVIDRCQSCQVRDHAICAGLADPELQALSAIGRRRTIAPGQVLNWAGDANLACANLVSGILKVTSSTADGREQIVGLLFSGDFVGQLFLQEATLTVTALTESDLCLYPRERFEDVLRGSHALDHALLRRTMASLNDARERMLTLGKRAAPERIAGFLLDLARRAAQDGCDPSVALQIPISRGDMADYLGLTIETVSRQLTRFKAMGAIALAKGGRSLDVTDMAILRSIADTG
jgi:CRP/FNR family transcriptional regulator